MQSFWREGYADGFDEHHMNQTGDWMNENVKRELTSEFPGLKFHRALIRILKGRPQPVLRTLGNDK